MPSALARLNRREEQAADERAAEAARGATTALSSTMRDAAQAAIEVALGDSGAGLLLERIQDAAQVRNAIEQPLTEDLLLESARVLNELEAALAAGYTMDLEGRAKIFNDETSGNPIVAEVTDADLQVVQSFPINGRSPEEWSRRLAEQLRWDVEGAVLAPVNGSATKLSALPVELEAVQLAHARNVKRLVSDAFFAGTQAATIEFTAHQVRRSRGAA